MANDTLKQLLQILSDGEFHSGSDIGDKLQMTRAGVWKVVKQAEALGFHIKGVNRLGYQLQDGVSLLSTKAIQKYLTPTIKKQIACLEVFDSIDSTNNYLLQRIYEHSKIPRVVTAEQQANGRGRRGRKWHSPYAQNIYLSMLWSFDFNPSQLQGLSLAIGVATFKVLEKLSLPPHIYLKWPNDIYWKNKKLAGVLIETLGEFNNSMQIIIGIGLNVNMPATESLKISKKTTSLYQITKIIHDRNQLIAALINETLPCLKQLREQGIKPFLNFWKKHDMLIGKNVKLRYATKNVAGKVLGIDTHGNLKVQLNKHKTLSVCAGEVSLEI